MQDNLPRRKNIRLEGYDYSRAGYYFITMCVEDKHEMLAKIVGSAALGVPRLELTEIGKIIKQYIENINTVYGGEIFLDKYIIMPNHIHMIIAINSCGAECCSNGTPRAAFPTKAKIPKVINSLKGLTTKKIGFSIWQKSYHDHIIRNEAEYLKIWQYIDQNPEKWAADIYFTN